MIGVSVIVTTYNRPDALRAVLDGLCAQQDSSFEVLVADDGSRDETRALVLARAATAPMPLLHLWQEDHGFRAAAARNRAASQAGGDYLIFLDGDCVPRAGWLAAHRELSEAGWMVAGNRILLSRELTQSVLAAREPIHAWTGQRWRAALASGGINRRWPFLRLPLGPLRKLGRRQWKRVRTCNLGLWRTDFERVNGFDETFEGWGYEDSDLAVRMINAGVQRKDGAFATGVLHLWHRENDRRNEGENWQKLLRRIASGEARAATGLDRSERPPGP